MSHLALVGLSYLGESLSDLGILHARLDQPEGGLAGEVGGHDDVSLPSRHGGFSASSQDEAVGDHGNESIYVSSEVNLDEVFVSQEGVRLTEQGSVVADHVVDRDAGWEGDTFVDEMCKEQRRK